MPVLDGTGLGYLLSKIQNAFIKKSDTQTVTGVPVDASPTASSSNLVTSGGVYSALSSSESTTNKVTMISSASTDTQYPSAKCVYDIVGDIESLLAEI